MNDVIKSVLPWLSTALGGPLAGIAATFVANKLGLEDNTVEAIKNVVNNADPKLLNELKGMEYDFQIQMTAMGYKSLVDLAAIEVQGIEAVNKTMQEEAKAEHWPSYTWRPYIGFMFGTYIASLWILPLFGRNPVELSTDMVLAIGGILGVASWFRGKAEADPNVMGPAQITPTSKLGKKFLG